MTKFAFAPNLRALLFLVLLLFSFNKSSAQKLNISGFSELVFESSFGDPASQEDLEVYESFDGDDEAIEAATHLRFPGFNLIFTSELSDRLTFQGEIVNSFEEGDLEIELLRSYIDYSINPKFNLQAGKVLSSIGYLNRNQRFYGYLNYSVETRDLVNKELGFSPTTTVGLKAYGTFEIGNSSSLTYHAVWGGMRGSVPEGSETLSGFEIGHDHANSPGIQGLVEYLTYVGETEVLIGLSAYSVGRIVGFAVEDGEEVPIGEEADELEEEGMLDRDEMNLSEFGFAPYIRIDGPKFQFLGEFHTTTFTDENGNLENDKFNYTAYSLEFVYKSTLANKSFYPYVRFDGKEIADGGYHPYFGLEQESDDELEKSFVPGSKELIFGFAWDVIQNNRLKLEYGRFLDGPFRQGNIRISTSFAF